MTSAITAHPLFWFGLGAVWVLVMLVAITEDRRDRAHRRRVLDARPAQPAARDAEPWWYPQ